MVALLAVPLGVVAVMRAAPGLLAVPLLVVAVVAHPAGVVFLVVMLAQVVLLARPCLDLFTFGEGLPDGLDHDAGLVIQRGRGRFLYW